MSRTIFRTLGSAGLLVLAACSSEINYADATAWEANISGVGGPTTLQGSLGAVSSGFNTRASIGLSEGEPGAVHPWLIRTGSCGTNGQVFGARASYRDVTLSTQGSNQGSGSAEAVVSQLLDEEGTYQVQVLESPTSDVVVACGDLSPAEF